VNGWIYNQCQFKGAEAIELVSNDLRLIILPDWGGRIVSITPRTSPDTEILLQPVLDRIPCRAEDTHYSANQSWGWDDLFPSISPCTIHDPELGEIVIPDHGELWSKKVQISYNEQECTLTTKGQILPYYFEKKLLPLQNGIRIEWMLKNISVHSFPYLWSAHPLFTLNSDTIVRVPPGVKVLSFEAPSRISTTFPINSETLQFRKTANKSALKYFHVSQILSTDLPIYLEHPSKGIRISIVFDINFLPYLGIWINTGGWGNQYTVALEPTTSYPDSLIEAQMNTSARILAPHGIESWWLDVYFLDSREKIEHGANFV
jgi:galactose mutarotase-like enzyme